VSAAVAVCTSARARRVSSASGSRGEAVSVQRVDIPATSIPAEQVDSHFRGFADIMRLDFPPMSSPETRELLGWSPTHPGVIADLDEGHYFATTAAKSMSR
jgi:hypothetical protein